MIYKNPNFGVNHNQCIQLFVKPWSLGLRMCCLPIKVLPSIELISYCFPSFTMILCNISAARFWLESYVHAYLFFHWFYFSCDSGCLRSFHLTEEHGEGSKCPSLGINSEEAKVSLNWVVDSLNSCLFLYVQIASCFLFDNSDDNW
jgi:hypothetical protein